MTYGDRFLTCGAYYLIASRYHSGAASKGYAILSRLSIMGYRPGAGIDWRGSEERSAAASLLWSRRKEILRAW